MEIEKATILVIEDEEPIRELIKLNLLMAGYRVLEAEDGLAGLNILRQQVPNLILLDIMLPKIDGYELLPKITEMNIPVIVLTAMNGLKDKMKGFQLGADDYITKPFEAMELLARVKAVLRRTESSQQARTAVNKSLVYDKIELHLAEHKVYLAGQEVELTLKEFELLQLLIEQKGKVLSRENLLTSVWGYEYAGNTRTVDIHIQRLRTKLNLEQIKTVYKVGYRLEELP